jgi:hypothetical protein
MGGVYEVRIVPHLFDGFVAWDVHTRARALEKTLSTHDRPNVAHGSSVPGTCVRECVRAKTQMKTGRVDSFTGRGFRAFHGSRDEDKVSTASAQPPKPAAGLCTKDRETSIHTCMHPIPSNNLQPLEYLTKHMDSDSTGLNCDP